MTRPLDDAVRAMVYAERRRQLLVLADQNPGPHYSFDCIDDVPFYSSEDIEAVHMRMHNNHLPILEAAGFIDRHDDNRTISIGRNFDKIRPLLEFVDQEMARVGAIDGQ